MIKLDTLKINKREITNKWSEFVLYALDKDNNPCKVTAIDFATGALNKFPHATEERALANIEKFKNYLIDNNINNYIEWQEIASDKAKMTFASVFSNKDYIPHFYN